uniref:Uncharacterized protein n=1 Tax=Lotharella oceanica TaxID=641309 RepID=A0A7S2XI79_9EUKA|eukprot:CAMPEP_0170177888 /NCGR_PEP_ID=MMETSP0040_2-20121228/11298_1 /TAXON_ID=641309 /ORGANISM="Lotharella oceanica, Strain CCMP622" /LENGTH=138 /DNA_ID=CAMNT_0010420737 /DNA_START=29 /DNA_END=445 /DNA_ORIENTATION=+
MSVAVDTKAGKIAEFAEEKCCGMDVVHEELFDLGDFLRIDKENTMCCCFTSTDTTLIQLKHVTSIKYTVGNFMDNLLAFGPVKACTAMCCSCCCKLPMAVKFSLGGNDMAFMTIFISDKKKLEGALIAKSSATRVQMK